MESVLKGRGLIRRDLEQHIADLLAPYGFVRREREGIFDCERGEVRQTIFLPDIARPTGISFNVNTGIRFHRVEELIARFEPAHPLLSNEDKLSRSTLGKHLGYHWRGLWQKSWTLRNREDAPEAAEKIVAYILKEAIPFFEKYSNMENAFGILAKDDEKASDYMAFDDSRAKKAIGLAYLLYGSESARETAKRKLAWLRTRPHADRASVEEFVRRLLANNGIPSNS